MVTPENIGLKFEMAICDACDIPYVGKYNYDKHLSTTLSSRLSPLKAMFPGIQHTAKQGSRYDFTQPNGQHLSAKTSKKYGKIAPQVIGQPSPQKFCDFTDLTFTNTEKLKEDIQGNIRYILPTLSHYTFDSPILYYVEKDDTIRLITLKEKIDWSDYKYEWTRTSDKWNNSSSLRIKEINVPLLEIQFHANRNNMAIRWSFENFLRVFNHKIIIRCF